MRWAVAFLGILVSIYICFWGSLTASSGAFGGDSPEFGIPIILIGSVLLLFTLFGATRLAVAQTSVVIVGMALLAFGVAWIENAVSDPLRESAILWPGIAFIVISLVLTSFSSYLWARKYRRVGTIITAIILVVVVPLVYVQTEQWNQQIQHSKSLLISHYDGYAWTAMNSGTKVPLFDVWVALHPMSLLVVVRVRFYTMMVIPGPL